MIFELKRNFCGIIFMFFENSLSKYGKRMANQNATCKDGKHRQVFERLCQRVFARLAKPKQAFFPSENGGLC